MSTDFLDAAEVTDKPDSINVAADRPPCATASDSITATDCTSAANLTASARANGIQPDPSSMTVKALQVISSLVTDDLTPQSIFSL